MSRNVRLAAAFFSLALIVRLGLLFTVFDGLQHGSAPQYGSAALGLNHGLGLTIEPTEVQSMSKPASNVRGNFMDYFRGSAQREVLTEFLPGPALLLAGLWKIVPIYNFAPYLVFQAVIDSLLIALFAVLMARRHLLLAVLTAALMIINLPVIKRTLMMGYDFWPQFGVLVVFLGVLTLQSDRYRRLWLFPLIGFLAAIPVWFRDLTTPLPFVVAAFLLYALRKQAHLSWGPSVARVALFLTPVCLSILLLALFRYETTENFRPTRSTLWHSFMAGVGQFPNPYGLTHNDQSVWAFGQTIDPELRSYTLNEMYLLPDSPYEKTLKEVAKKFVQEHPLIFLRNFGYRIAIMISPPFYADGDFLPRSVAERLFPLGFILFPLWCIGMIHLRKTLPFVFGLTLAVFLYFFVAFGWFYVVGRVILPFFFLSIMVWISGLIAIVEWLQINRKKYENNILRRPT